MKREEVINRFIGKYNYSSYLEIGTRKGDTFRKINCPEKTGVDVRNYLVVTYNMTSDEFFRQNKDTFNIIFIDGLHHSDQVIRDIINSLSVLSDGGTIVCHDMNPVSRDSQIIPRGERKIWNGDCWKAWVRLRQTRDDLEMFVVDTDYGLGIIKRGRQKILPYVDHLTYDKLDKNRQKWLGLISGEKFLKKYL